MTLRRGLIEIDEGKTNKNNPWPEEEWNSSTSQQQCKRPPECEQQQKNTIDAERCVVQLRVFIVPFRLSDRKECLAVLHGMLHHYVYIYAYNFTLCSMN